MAETVSSWRVHNVDAAVDRVAASAAARIWPRVVVVRPSPSANMIGL